MIAPSRRPFPRSLPPTLPRSLALSLARSLPRSLPHPWTISALALAAAIVALGCALDEDTWWALKMGELSVRAGRPVTDVALAFAPTVPGVANGQWLAQAALYLLYDRFGETGLSLAAGLMIWAALALTFAGARLAGAGPRAAAVAVLLAAALAANNLAVRTQVFSYVLFAFVYLLLRFRHRRPALLLALPPTFALWANLHGAFSFGLALVGLHLVGDSVRAFGGAGERGVSRSPGRSEGGGQGGFSFALALSLAASAAAAALNPLGPGVYAYLASVAGHASTYQLVSEWQPPSPGSPIGLLLAASVLLILALAWRDRRRVTVAEWLVLLTFAYLAATSLRHVVWWGMVAAPVLARLLARALPTRDVASSNARPRSGLVVALLVVALAAAAPLYRPVLAARSPPPRTTPPVAAANFLATLPAGSRLYQHQPWTGYLAWRLWPRQQLIAELRIEAFSADTWGDYLAVARAESDWAAVLDRYGVDYLVLSPDHRLVEPAGASGRWEPVYRDDLAVVLARGAP